MRRHAAIAGIGQSAFGKTLPESETELALVAIRAALHDAGIAPRDVDGFSGFNMAPDAASSIARNLGCEDVTFFAEVGFGGGAGCATVGMAAMAVERRQADVVVAWRSRKRGDPSTRPWANTTMEVSGKDEWSRPWGLVRPVDEVAVLTRRAMFEFGYTRDHLANVALAFRKHAQRNPNALMAGRPMTRDDYFAARWISEPLCLFDNCLESDGAVAAVIVGSDRARDARQPAVVVEAFAQGMNPQHLEMTNYFTPDPLRGPSWSCAGRLWASTDYGPADVDVAQIYDAFSPLVPLSLEGYGFCERGEGGAFTDNGNIEWPDGALPVNTSGGSMSEAYVHGFNLIAEGVRQIRGTSTCQVPDARLSFVSSGEGVPTSALLLRAYA